MSLLQRVSKFVANPGETIEVILAIALILIAIRTGLPSEWVGSTSAYGNNAAKFLFAILTSLPAFPILYLAIKRDAKGYEQAACRRRRALFWMAVTFLYLLVLKIAIGGLLPFVATVGLLVMCAVSTVLCLRLVSR